VIRLVETIGDMPKRAAKPEHSSPQSEPDRILTTSELLERIPLDRTTIWRMVREKRFPPPIQLTTARIGWRWSAVAAWLAERERHRIPARSYFGRSDAMTPDHAEREP
jgi:prophage regulatory protein